MGEKISRIIKWIWIFSFGKSSDSDDEQNNRNETLPSPPHLPINSSSTNISIRIDSNSNDAALLPSSLDSSSNSNSFFADNNLLDPLVDRSDSVVGIGSSALEYHASLSNTPSNLICHSYKEFAYPQSNVPVWINHYCCEQRILLVGEGDFSFSACLGKAFGSASKIIATSLDSIEFLQKNYRKARANIQSLKDRGCIVLHGVNATQMASHLLLNGITFERIIFNFPLAGFYSNETRESQILRHRALVRGFLENAKKMMSKNGEIHITHKSNGFFAEWKIEAVALACGLQLVEDLHFDFRDYPGYHTKYGFGGDKNFNCNPSRIYKFACISH